MAQAATLTGRYLNALCYLISGVAILVTEATKGGGGVMITVLGVAAIAYGLYIALSRGSYWVSTYTYVIPVVLVILAIAT